MILILIILLGCIAWTGWCWWQILPLPVWGKAVCTGLYISCFLLLFVHYLLEERMPRPLAVATYEIGTSWTVFFLYNLLLFAALSLGVLVHLIPEGFLKDSLPGTCTVAGILAVLLVCGNLHYRHKYRETLDIQTGKPLERPLTIVLASDLHAGYHNRRAEIARWVDLINAEHPDLVLFSGDIIDGSLKAVREDHIEEEFRRIEAPVYACLGNHEYISGEKGSESFYRDAGIRLLRDSSAVDGGIRILGRDDRSNPGRAPLSALASPADSLFSILLDHQPYHLEEAEAAGIDFQFSGHTHHGQVWPANWVTDLMYEKAYGAHRRGHTRYFISSGLGIWGGKFRIGTRSEYIVLTLHP